MPKEMMMMEKRKRAKDPENPKTPGRTPTWEPTDDERRLVKTLAGHGMRGDDIADLIINPYTGKGISKATLYKYFEQEMKLGRATGDAKLREALFRNAVDNMNVSAQIFLAKTRLGMSEKVNVAHMGPNGEPLRSGPVFVVPGAVPPDQWEQWATEQQERLVASSRGEDD